MLPVTSSPRENLPVLAPPSVKPHVSVARVPAAWYVAATSGELKAAKPIARTVLGIPLVLFRDGDGRASALLDRCPHRGVPLSLGRVEGGRLQCSYHGWCFDGAGICREVPGLMDAAEGPARRTPAYPVQEQQGYLWVWMDPVVEPDVPPFDIPHMQTPGYSVIRRRVTAPGTLHATIENALDVPHTAFLHRGLFRGTGERNEIEAIVWRLGRSVYCEYIGEPRPEGFAGRLLAPGGGLVEHYDRFHHPSILQVEYRLGADTHVLVTGCCTPISDFETALYATVTFKIPRVPTWLIRWVGVPLGLSIFRQDVVVLAQQTAGVQRFGGEQYVSSEIDMLGGPIWRLMREAERGELAPDEEGAEAVELRRVRLSV